MTHSNKPMNTVGEPAVNQGQEGSLLVSPNDRRATPVVPEREGDLLSRLKKKGLDPQRLLDLANLGTSGKARRQMRHKLIGISFFLCVVIPSLLFSGYMFFWASDQYNSTVAFAIRSSTQAAATDILGMVLDSGQESTASNSYILHDYIQSQAIIEDLEPTLDIQSIFNRKGADWLFRMGEGDLPIELKRDYWNGMVDVNYDATSGVITVDVRSFNPEDSVRVAQAILERSDAVVNKLSEVNRRETIRFAEETVARAETRLRAIRREMANYRDRTQEVSPEDNAKLTMETIAGLEQEVASKQAELKILDSYQVQNSPRVRLLRETVSALQSQIRAYRNKLGDGGVLPTEPSAEPEAAATTPSERLSQRISTYSDLKLEEEFANSFYATALAGLEKARQDAAQKHMYLATFIHPTLSQQAEYPHRVAYALFTALALLGFWGVSVLLYYNIRDRS